MTSPLNSETLLGNKPVGFVESKLIASTRQEIKNAIGIIDRLFPTNAPTPPPTVPPLKLPYRFDGEYGAELTKLVRSFAEDVRGECTTLEAAKLTPEWSQLRALYFLYCNGLEDALYNHTAVLAAAIRAGKRAWIGDIVMDAWIEYADAALAERVADEIRYLNSRDEALSEERGR